MLRLPCGRPQPAGMHVLFFQTRGGETGLTGLRTAMRIDDESIGQLLAPHVDGGAGPSAQGEAGVAGFGSAVRALHADLLEYPLEARRLAVVSAAVAAVGLVAAGDANRVLLSRWKVHEELSQCFLALERRPAADAVGMALAAAAGVVPVLQQYVLATPPTGSPDSAA